MTNDLVAFLKAHLDEDADLARRCDGAEFSAGGRARLRTRSGVRGVLPSRPPSTQAEPSRRGPWRPGRSYSGALHLDAMNHERSSPIETTGPV